MTDCPECRSAGSVRRGFCDVCYAETDERGPGHEAADLPPAVLGPAVPLRFSDVVDELAAIVRLAASVEDGDLLAAGCRRAERLLHSLRGQFLSDLGLRDALGSASIAAATPR